MRSPCQEQGLLEGLLNSNNFGDQSWPRWLHHILCLYIKCNCNPHLETLWPGPGLGARSPASRLHQTCGANTPLWETIQAER